MGHAPYRARVGKRSCLVSTARCAALSFLVAELVGCAPPLDTTRQVQERGTLGEEIFQLFHRDLEREDPPRAAGFEIEHGPFVRAIDHLFREDELAETQELLLRLLPLYDDGTIPASTRKLAEVTRRLEADTPALHSLAALLSRDGYVSLAHQRALATRIARYPRYRELVQKGISLSLAHDGLDAGGQPAPSEDDTIRRLQESLSRALAELELSADTERMIVLVADLMLTEDSRLASESITAPGGPASIVARDVRGLARVAAPSGNAMPGPFVDRAPADGLADIDADGRFVDQSGAPIELPPFASAGDRDERARALVTPGGPPIYQYVELDRTILAGLMRDARTLIERGTHQKARRTIERLLGEPIGGHYVTETNTVLDLGHAVASTVDVPELPDLLELTGTLLEDHEGALAYLAVEAERQLDVADHHNVGLRPGNTFFDDIMRVIRKILLVPGLAEEILDALDDPAVLRLPEAAATLSEFKHPRITEEDFRQGRCFTTRVDRSAPDRRDNQSLHQRVLHLIHDTKGARYEPSFIGVPLGFIFSIEDQAEFYMLSIIGQAEVPSLVATLTGLSTHPTPDELAVFLNADQTFGNPQGNEGLDVMVNDGDTLFAASASGMVDGLRPLVRVFHDRGQLDLLFELFEVLHVHWASAAGGDYQDQDRGSPRYSELSGIRDYEPLLIDVFRTTHVLAAVRKLLIETETLRSSSGKTVQSVLLALGRKLLNKDLALRTRGGAQEVLIDRERVNPLSPFDLIRAARHDLKSVVGRSAQGLQDWDELVDELHRLFLETELVAPETGRFKSSRLKPIATTLVRFMVERARKHRTAGDLSGWPARVMVDDLAELISSDELPAIFDLLRFVEEDAELEEMMVELRDQLLSEAEGFPELLAVGGDQLSAAKDATLAVPFLRFAGKELHPDNRLTFTLLDLASKLLAADPEERFLETARRGIEPTPAGEAYGAGIFSAIRQTNRVDPLERRSLETEDLRQITGVVGRYLVDHQHGLEKFYELVSKR